MYFGTLNSRCASFPIPFHRVNKAKSLNNEMYFRHNIH